MQYTNIYSKVRSTDTLFQ